MFDTTTEPSPAATGIASKPSGPAMAVLLAAGIGVFVTGLATVLATASSTIKDALNWWAPAGPLSGKSGAGVIAWLVAWGALHLWWRRTEVPFRRIWWITIVFVVLGLVLMFPPVFEAFERH